MKFFDLFAHDAHTMAVEKGFWEHDRNDGELLMLIVSELAEALEALRHGRKPSEHIPAFTCLEEELADAMIRIGDMAAVRGVRLHDAIVAKMAFNATRARKHGKLF